MARGEPEKGDKVSWKWGGGAPGGTVAEKKTEGEIAIKSHRGNTIKKKADPENPAVHISRSGNDVVKRASEITIEQKGSGGSHAGDKRKAGSDDSDKETKAKGGTTANNALAKNKDGKEVRKGGKEANKKQKRDQDAGSDNTSDSDQDRDDSSKPKQGSDKKMGDQGKTENKKHNGSQANSPANSKHPTKGSQQSASKPKAKTESSKDQGNISSRTRSHNK